MTWGIGTPARDTKSRLTRHINARVENLVANALWRAALRETRCVVVSDGFYEWTGESKASDRRPFFLQRPDDELILMAGLWRWRDSGDGYLQEFTIVTSGQLLTQIGQNLRSYTEVSRNGFEGILKSANEQMGTVVKSLNGSIGELDEYLQELNEVLESAFQKTEIIYGG
jgi:hypothetical protein